MSFRCLHPERIIEARFLKDVNALREVFTLVKVPVDKKKTKRYWRDAVDREAEGSSKKPPSVDPTKLVFDFPTSDSIPGGAPSTSAQQQSGEGGRAEMFPQVQIGMVSPVRDFTTAVYGSGVTSALLGEAFQKMTTVTVRLLQQPGYDYVDKAVDCMIAMKQAAICYGDDPIAVESYHRLLDDTLAKCRDNTYLWERVVAKRVTYVCRAEAAASTMTEEQADAFLLQPSQPQSSPARRNVVAAGLHSLRHCTLELRHLLEGTWVHLLWLVRRHQMGPMPGIGGHHHHHHHPMMMAGPPPPLMPHSGMMLPGGPPPLHQGMMESGPGGMIGPAPPPPPRMMMMSSMDEYHHPPPTDPHYGYMMDGGGPSPNGPVPGGSMRSTSMPMMGGSNPVNQSHGNTWIQIMQQHSLCPALLNQNDHPTLLRWDP
ncbi:hypothetical protein Pmar_PMAR018959, partial [Perkinsus marinus ATCC 50983]